MEKIGHSHADQAHGAGRCRRFEEMGGEGKMRSSS